MSARDRNRKSLEQKLLDLDAHMFLLRQHLHGLRDSASHLKGIAAELRTLVCKSSGTEGLLWRLAEELKVADDVALHLPGKLKQDHPLVRGLEFMIVPIFRAGKGDPRLAPGNYSLREVIKESEALAALGKPLTHEYLIKAIAQQMGSAHEDAGLETALTQLSKSSSTESSPILEFWLWMQNLHWKSGNESWKQQNHGSYFADLRTATTTGMFPSWLVYSASSILLAEFSSSDSTRTRPRWLSSASPRQLVSYFSCSSGSNL